MYAVGSNACGQLGIGSLNDQNMFTRVPSLDGVDVVQIDAGSNHSLVLSLDGTVYGAGDNSAKQLGLVGPLFDHFEALPVVSSKSISAGWNTSFVIDAENRIWAVGDNKQGQLGIGKYLCSTWVRLKLENAKKVAAGINHTLFLLQDGSLWGCGNPKKGVFGVEQDEILFEPILITKSVLDCAVGQYHSVIVTRKGIFVSGRNRFGLLGSSCDVSFTSQFRMILSTKIDDNTESPDTDEKGDDPMIRVFSGWSTIAVMYKSGRVMLIGRGDFGQLGCKINNRHTTSFVQLSICLSQLSFGSEHGLGICPNGDLVTWGWNEHGNCGNGTVNPITSPTVILSRESKIIGCGGGHSLVFCGVDKDGMRLNPCEK